MRGERGGAERNGTEWNGTERDGTERNGTRNGRREILSSPSVCESDMDERICAKVREKEGKKGREKKRRWKRRGPGHANGYAVPLIWKVTSRGTLLRGGLFFVGKIAELEPIRFPESFPGPTINLATLLITRL